MQRKTCNIEEKEIINERMAQHWLTPSNFHTDLTTKERSCSSCLSSWNIAITREAIEKQPSIRTL